MIELGTRYERIGRGYARLRREDPRIAERINAALGDARTVVNVGAGAGSYEPRDRQVIPIEPSDVMAAQRPPALPPAIRATAGRLPLRDDSVDAAMAILTVHHWDSEREAGVRELRRVASGPVAILTYLPEVSNQMWLVKDYLPEVGELDSRIFPDDDVLAGWLAARPAWRRCPSIATRRTGCSAPSGRIPSGSSIPMRATPPRDSPARRRRS
jgi:SAM-dependent methyltransferase